MFGYFSIQAVSNLQPNVYEFSWSISQCFEKNFDWEQFGEFRDGCAARDMHIHGMPDEVLNLSRRICSGIYDELYAYPEEELGKDRFFKETGKYISGIFQGEFDSSDSLYKFINILQVLSNFFCVDVRFDIFIEFGLENQKPFIHYTSSIESYKYSIIHIDYGLHVDRIKDFCSLKEICVCNRMVEKDEQRGGEDELVNTIVERQCDCTRLQNKFILFRVASLPTIQPHT